MSEYYSDHICEDIVEELRQGSWRPIRSCPQCIFNNVDWNRTRPGTCHIHTSPHTIDRQAPRFPANHLRPESVASSAPTTSKGPRSNQLTLADVQRRLAAMKYRSNNARDQMSIKVDRTAKGPPSTAREKKSDKKMVTICTDKCLSLNELKQTLELLEIPLGNSAAPPLNYDEIVSELKRYNKEQRAFEMVDWATSRGWASRYLNQVNKDKDKRKAYEQQDLVWADHERKIKWRVLESVIDGDFYSVAKVRERQHFNQRRRHKK